MFEGICGISVLNKFILSNLYSLCIGKLIFYFSEFIIGQWWYKIFNKIKSNILLRGILTYCKKVAKS